MVSLGYLIIYWVHGLPWRDVVEDDRILNMKQDIPVETLCLCPPEFKTYFNHIGSLGLDEKPDYKYLRKLVKEAFDRNGFVWDYIFDWHGPERSPVSQERLVAAFKSMYHELGEAEVQCLTFDHFLRQLTSINPDQLRRASDMHISIHARFHDNFLASQHPSASPALRRLARQYCMPERLRDGIHVFLESLRYLPDTQDCMLSFSYSAYLAMIVFHEEFPNFDDTWLESLGHLSRYLFFITDDQRFWMLACSWYSKASNQYPKIGRFHQDVAITSRSPFQKLFYGCKALCAEDPLDVRKSILDGFDVILEGDGSSQSSLDPLDVALLEAHAILFTGKKKEHFQLSFKKLLDLANTHPERVTVQIAIINITAILGFASERSFMGRRNVKEIDAFKNALRINNSILKLLLRNAHTTILPFLYTILVFMHCMSHYPGAMRHLEFPWKLSSNLLNSLPAEDVNPECIEVLRLQLDQALSGLSWAKGHFENANLQGKSLVERIRSLMHDLAGKDTHEACSTPSGNDEVSTLSSGVEGICLGDLDD
jgi:hypothetical protein